MNVFKLVLGFVALSGLSEVEAFSAYVTPTEDKTPQLGVRIQLMRT